MKIQLRNKNISIFFNHPELVAKAVESIRFWFDKFNGITGLNLSMENDEPVVFFQSSRVGGYVWPRKYNNRVFLNAPLFIANVEEYLNDTIPHEVAHIFQLAINPPSADHGPERKRLMRLASKDPTRCHRYDITVAVKTYRYICSCKKWNVSKILHNKMQRGQRRICNSCRKNLIPLVNES